MLKNAMKSSSVVIPKKLTIGYNAVMAFVSTTIKNACLQKRIKEKHASLRMS